MDVRIQEHPEIVQYLDPTLPYGPLATRTVRNGTTILVVRQISEFEGDVVEFVEEGGRFRPVQSLAERRTLGLEAAPDMEIMAGTVCTPSAAGDYPTLIDHVREQVDIFDSSDGPDGGNLACVWTVRKLAKKALDRWITRTDSTSEFDSELRRCFAPADRHEDVPAGGIVISPTIWTPRRKTGHVGFLGPMQAGGSRKIYSNSSSAAKLKQNFTVDTWTQRYKVGKGLAVNFYRLPSYGTGLHA